MLRPLWLLLGLLATAGAAHAQATAVIPSDTLPGHARLVRHLSATLCAELQGRQAADVAQLSGPAAQHLLEQLMAQAMRNDSITLLDMLRQARQQGRDARQVGEKVGYDATLELGHACPAAMPLLVRLGLTKEVQQSAARQPTLSATDRQALQPLALGICGQLSVTNARQPFASLTPAERQERLGALFHQQFVAYHPQLLRHYTEAQLASETFMESLGEKVAYLMMGQSSCTQFILLLEEDEAGRLPATKR